MKGLLGIGVALALSTGAFAQWNGRMTRSFPPLMGPSYPGVGGALPIVNPFSNSVPFAQRLGATISGFGGYNGAPSGVIHSGHRRGHGGVFYPMAYPVFSAGYELPPEQPDVTVAPPPAPATPQQPVIINQYFGPKGEEQNEPEEQSRPPVQSYTAPSVSRPAPSQDQPVFFIALRDNSVYTAVAYWIENGTLNYVTPQGQHNQVSLSLVDRATTDRLNQGSKYQLHLPEQ
jgi:hypothetical protein